MNMVIKKVKSWVERNDKYLSPLFFFAGFVLDNFTLTRIDLFFDNLVLLTYLSLAILIIIVMNLIHSGKLKKLKKKFPLILSYLSFFAQFVFGGLFSGYVIFYTKSASWASSWIFLLIIYALFIANERFRNFYKKIEFQLVMLFVAIFSFLIFFFPVIFKRISEGLFLLSGFVSLFFIFIFLQFLKIFIIKIKKKERIKILKNVVIVYLIFNLMYFLNIIPPVPLSLKEIGIYQNISRLENGNYFRKKFEFPWYQFGNYFLEINSPTVYLYSSVFAPTDLNTEIINVWQKYNKKTREWEIINKVAYLITGGRGSGYRGYSFITNATEGKWRVDVTNKKGQILGRIKFKIN